tara:strand:- start:361 stop:639 length:279 start_codon:yes stop_codon:yes gene_type:complete
MFTYSTKELVQEFGITEEGLNSRLHCFAESLKCVKIRGSTSKVLYTDGDGGAIVFTGFSEMFEEEGLTISLVADSNYCDITFETLEKVISIL